MKKFLPINNIAMIFFLISISLFSRQQAMAGFADIIPPTEVFVWGTFCHGGEPRIFDNPNTICSMLASKLNAGGCFNPGVAYFNPRGLDHPRSDLGWGCMFDQYYHANPNQTGFQIGTLIKDAFNNQWVANGAICETGYTFGSPDFGLTRICSRNASTISPFKDCPTCGVGNPILPTTGMKYQIELDYSTFGKHELKFERTYRSIPLRSGSSGENGMNWTNTFKRRIDFRLRTNTSLTVNTVRADRPDGTMKIFGFIGGQWISEADVADRIVELKDSGGVRTGWQYIDATTNEVDNYDVNGRLVSIVSLGGYTQTMQYSQPVLISVPNPTNSVPQPASTQAPGYLISVSDSLGRQLNFTYSQAGVITSITTPSGIISYTYDATLNLTSVTKPDGSKINYLYNESANTSGANLPNHLTGMTDGSGQRLSTYKYDSQSRGISTEGIAGAEKYTFAYSAGATTVTEPDGQVKVYRYTNILNSLRVTSVTSGSSSKTNTYDANGFVQSETNEAGVKTVYTRDSLGRVLTKTEGFGTAQARTETTIWHSTLNLPIKIVEPLMTTTYDYDSNGNILKKTESENGQSKSWSYTYNSLGQKLTADGPRTDVNDITTYSYDEKGNLLTTTNALNQTITNTYDSAGNILTSTDYNGVLTEYKYDSNGKVTSISKAGRATNYEYGPTGKFSKITYPDGTSEQYTLDSSDRVISEKNIFGFQKVFTLNSVTGLLTKFDLLDAANSSIGSWIFSKSNPDSVTMTTPLSQTIKTDYDSMGNLIKTTDNMGRVNSKNYDEFGRLSNMTDAAGRKVDYTYDSADQITSFKDAKNNSTKFVNSSLNGPSLIDSPDSGKTNITYDEYGNVTSLIDARGKKITQQFDALNRLILVKFTDGTSWSYSYDKPGQIGYLSKITDPTGFSEWVYDITGRVSKRIYKIGGKSISTSYTYDTIGKITTMTYPSGVVVTYHYGSGENGPYPTSIDINGTPLLNNLIYNDKGFLTSFSWGNGTQAQRNFDAEGKPSKFSLGAGFLNFSYDQGGRITNITDTTSNGLTQSYQYDLIDQIIGMNSAKETINYAYDIGGNRLSRISSVTGEQTSTIASSSNRLINYVTGDVQRNLKYDLSGNVISDGDRKFVYNAASRLISVRSKKGTVKYKVNALGQRVEKSGPGVSKNIKRFIYSEDDLLLGEYDSKGKALQEIIYFLGVPYAVIVDSKVYYIHTDHLGTPRLITNSSDNSLVWRWSGEAFGSSIAEEDPANTGAKFVFNQRFPGQFYDAETGIHYNYHRDYDPALGRYLQSDPIGLKGGANTYAYVDNSPIMNTDPSGLLLINFLSLKKRIGHKNKTQAEAFRAIFDLARQAPEVVNVIGHGSCTDGIENQTRSFGDPRTSPDIDPLKLCDMIERMPGFKKGMKVRLFSCQTGCEKSDGFAEELSKCLENSIVCAPKFSLYSLDANEDYGTETLFGITGKADGTPRIISVGSKPGDVGRTDNWRCIPAKKPLCDKK